MVVVHSGPISRAELETTPFRLPGQSGPQRGPTQPVSAPRLNQVQAPPSLPGVAPLNQTQSQGPTVLADGRAVHTVHCPPELYALKNYICPWREKSNCNYRAPKQNYLTKHVTLMHDTNYRAEYKRSRRKNGLNASKPAGGHSTGDGQPQTNPTLNSPQKRSLPSDSSAVEVPPAKRKRTAEGNGETPPRAVDTTPLQETVEPVNSLPRPRLSGEETAVSPENNTTTPVQSADNGPFSIRLKENFTMVVNGSSTSGKTYFVSSLLYNLDTFCEKPPTKIVWIYYNDQHDYDALRGMAKFVDVAAFENSTETEIQKYLVETLLRDVDKSTTHTLFVFDDCQLKPTIVSAISALFSGTGRHNNISLIYICHHLYDGKTQKHISDNANYLVIFPNRRFVNQATVINNQIYPGKPGLIAEMFNAVSNAKPHQYLFINFTAQENNKLRFLSDLFSTDHIVKAFIPV